MRKGATSPGEQRGQGVNDTESLLGYLRGVGSLSGSQVEYLRERGFLPAMPGPATNSEEDPDWYTYHPVVEGPDDTDLFTPAPRKRGGGRASRGPILKAEALAAR